jgi:hypothetical protein
LRQVPPYGLPGYSVLGFPLLRTCILESSRLGLPLAIIVATSHVWHLAVVTGAS